MDCIDGPKGLPSHLRVRDPNPERFFHADHELEGVDRVQSEPVRAEKRQIVADLVRSIKFLTSISLMRGRRSTSDIMKRAKLS